MVNTVMGIAIGIIMFAQYPVPLPVRNVPRDSVGADEDWESVGKEGYPAWECDKHHTALDKSGSPSTVLVYSNPV